MKINRSISIKNTNNPENPNKNICALEVAKHFGVKNATRYLHTTNDLMRAVRSKYKANSRKSQLSSPTMGKLKAKINKLRKEGKTDSYEYIVIVPGHVLVLDSWGNVKVDTAPRKRDKRKVVKVFGIQGMKN